MATLFIKSLTCNETEDLTGSDECLLEVFTDDGRKPYRQDMNNGDVWDINDQFPFTTRAKIRLWDLDLGHWPDYHDLLGTAIIRVDPVVNATATFTQDGADYELTYDVLV
ncbi:MAG: hypothetical protein U0350_50135 [Caldilineaceae bacterium]